MSTLSAATQQAPRKPPRIVVLPPSAFAEDWPQRPASSVALGLRLVSERDLQVAMGEARKAARAHLIDEQLTEADRVVAWDAYNDAEVRYAMARATTDPNDVSRPYFLFAEDTIKLALTSEGIRRLWDEYVILSRSSGIDLPQAEDEELERLGRVLQRPGCLDSLEANVQKEVRKLCAHLLRQIGEDELEPAEEDGYVALGVAG